MNEIADDLRRFAQKRWLISIRRSTLERGAIQGYVLAVSDQIVLLQSVRDFELNGLLALNVGDITSVQASHTDRFQHQVMDEEGLLDTIKFDTSICVADWRQFFESIVEAYRVIIVEEEDCEKPVLTIGPVLSVQPEAVVIHHFSGAGTWEEKPETIAWEWITCCQLGTRYIGAYVDHFDRNALWPNPQPSKQ